MMQRKKLLLILAALPLVFFLVIGGSAWMLGASFRIDLTENKLYTLSGGTQDILRSLEKPVEVVVYFSDEASESLPELRFFAQRVQDLLSEMTVAGGDQLMVRWVDPEPFSEAEDDALLAGLTGIPVGQLGTQLYFGAVVSAADGGRITLPLFSPEREALLEYEFIQAIERVQKSQLPKVAIITDLPIQNWVIYQDLLERFALIEVSIDDGQLPAELDALVVIQPSALNLVLTEQIIGHIDSGKPIVLFVDPVIQSVAGQPQPSPVVEALLQALGVSMVAGQFVADRVLALEVVPDAGALPIEHPAVLGLGPDHISQDDVVSAQLNAIHVASAGALQSVSESRSTFEPLWWSSNRSSVLPVTRLTSDQPIEAVARALMSEVAEMDAPKVMAARVGGDVSGIVVADVDFLDDRYWVNRQRFLGTELLDRFAGNGAFVLNALDQLVGDPRLVAVRSRDVTYRPFALLDELRGIAQARLVATEQRLSLALSEANQALATLQLEDQQTLTPEKREELQGYVELRRQLRQDLRQVRRELDDKIAGLEQRIIWINLLLMPLVILAWLLLAPVYQRWIAPATDS